VLFLCLGCSYFYVGSSFGFWLAFLVSLFEPFLRGCIFGDKALLFYSRRGRFLRCVCVVALFGLRSSERFVGRFCLFALVLPALRWRRSGDRAGLLVPVFAFCARVFDRALWLVWYHCFSFSARLTRYRVPAMVTYPRSMYLLSSCFQSAMSPISR